MAGLREGVAVLREHQHGKSRVRVARVWRLPGGRQEFAEWEVHTMLESAMAPAYLSGDNAGMTATDTQKNTVYWVAQRLEKPCGPEAFALALARHFVKEYPLVSRAKVEVEQRQWVRAEVGGREHAHGFVKGGETRFARVEHGDGQETVTSGLRGLTVCKTTQSGYEGYLRDGFTLLPETRERLLATTMQVSWRFSSPPPCWEGAFRRVREAVVAEFFGPAEGGVYSPSVQRTLFLMAKACLEQVEGLESMYFNLPNIHFLPCSPVMSEFKHDVYVATSEPHGNIEATVTRAEAVPHARL